MKRSLILAFISCLFCIVYNDVNGVRTKFPVVVNPKLPFDDIYNTPPKDLHQIVFDLEYTNLSVKQWDKASFMECLQDVIHHISPNSNHYIPIIQKIHNMHLQQKWGTLPHMAVARVLFVTCNDICVYYLPYIFMSGYKIDNIKARINKQLKIKEDNFWDYVACIGSFGYTSAKNDYVHSESAIAAFIFANENYEKNILNQANFLQNESGFFIIQIKTELNMCHHCRQLFSSLVKHTNTLSADTLMNQLGNYLQGTFYQNNKIFKTYIEDKKIYLRVSGQNSLYGY